MPNLLALEWNRDLLGGIEAQLTGGRLQVLRTWQWAWPDDIDRKDEPKRLGVWLKEKLAASGVDGTDVIVVLPREDIVTRRLDLPAAPEAELPDLVRFQAAAKSATPLDQLALDFVPLPTVEGEPGQPALVATMDRELLEQLRACCAAAGLQMLSVQGSPFSTAEVAVRFERQHGDDPNATTLVVFQDHTRVEISILQRLGLVFSHQTRINPQDERAIRGTLAEINRSVVTLGQMMHTTIEVARVCLMHGGDVDLALERSLSERFAGKLKLVDPASDQAVSIARDEDAARLASLTPAVGALLGRLQQTVPAVDFLKPRQPPPKRDERKRKMIQIGAATAAGLLVIGGAAWAYGNHLDGQIRALEMIDGDLSQTLAGAGPPLEAHSRIEGWRMTSVDPLDELDRFNRLLPGADRLLLLNVQVQPGRADTLARITGGGIARTERDIAEMFDTLTASGYRVQPQVSDVYKLDPDYPHKFSIDVSRLTPPPPSESRSGSSTQ